MNIIVVDDELITREWFGNTIKKIGKDIKLIGTASNGQEALELIKKNEIDIVITDIKMPVMDGLELMSIITKEYKSVYIVVISAFSEFEFAIQALKKGAYDYLLKPEITIEKLNKLLLDISNDISSKISINKLNEEEIFILKNNFLEKIIYGEERALSEFEHEKGKVGIKLNYNKISSISIGLCNNGLIEETLLRKTFNKVIKHSGGDYELYKLKDTVYIILFNNSHNSMKINYDKIVDMYHEIGKKLRVHNENINLTGIITLHSNIAKIHESLDLLIYNIEQKIFNNDTSLIFLDNEKMIKDNEVTKQLIKEFNDKLNQGINYELFRYLKEEVIINLKKSILPSQNIINISMEILYLIGLKLRELRMKDEWFEEVISDARNTFVKIKTFEEYEKKMIEQLDYCYELITNNVQYSQPIQSAYEYIMSNYKEDISLDQLAYKVGLNRTYFSELFKKETGTNYIKLLAEIRIKKAKGLLLTSKLKIHDIAFEVGFSNSTYFSKVFKKMENLTPQEYRDQNK